MHQNRTFFLRHLSCNPLPESFLVPDKANGLELAALWGLQSSGGAGGRGRLMLEKLTRFL